MYFIVLHFIMLRQKQFYRPIPVWSHRRDLPSLAAQKGTAIREYKHSTVFDGRKNF